MHTCIKPFSPCLNTNKLYRVIKKTAEYTECI